MRNEEALASQVYFPETEGTSQKIYELMSMPLDPNTTDDDVYPADLVQENIDSFNSLPITTAYEKAIVNPRQCEIDEIDTLMQDITPLITDVGNAIEDRDDVLTTQEITDLQTDFSEVVDIPQETTDGMAELKEHTDRVSSNLPSLVGVAQTALGLGAVMLALNNPCLHIDDFFGSLTSKGKQLMNGLKDRLAALKAKLQQMKAQIQNFVTNVKAQIQALVDEAKAIASGIKSQLLSIANMVKDEAKKFAKAFIDAARSGLASLLSLLPKDPCLKNLVGAVATAGLAAIIK